MTTDPSPKCILGNYDERGFYTHGIYSWNGRTDTGLRLAWVQGVEDFGQDRQFRISPRFRGG